MIGTGTVTLAELVSEEPKKLWVELLYKNKKAGDILIESILLKEDENRN